MALRNFDLPAMMRGNVTLADDEGRPIIWKTLAVQALETELPDEKLSGKERYDRCVLADRIAKGGNVELTLEELSRLKEMMGRYFRTPIVGPAWRFLEGE